MIQMHACKLRETLLSWQQIKWYRKSSEYKIEYESCVVIQDEREKEKMMDETKK